MSWYDKALKQHKMEKQIDEIMQSKKYQDARRQDQIEASVEAFDRFLTLSVDYMHRYLGFGQKRILAYLKFITEQLAVYEREYVPTDENSNFFYELQDALMDELKIDIWGDRKNDTRPFIRIEGVRSGGNNNKAD